MRCCGRQDASAVKTIFFISSVGDRNNLLRLPSATTQVIISLILPALACCRTYSRVTPSFAGDTGSTVASNGTLHVNHILWWSLIVYCERYGSVLPVYLRPHPMLIASLFGSLECGHQRHRYTASWIGAWYSACPKPSDYRSLSTTRQFGLRVQTPNTIPCQFPHLEAIVTNVISQSSCAAPRRELLVPTPY